MRSSLKSILVLALVAGSACAASAQPLGDAGSDAQNTGDPILPSPKQDNGTHFAPNVATAGSAFAGTALSATPADGKDGCAPLNPCAVVTPAANSMNATPDDAPPLRKAQRRRNKPEQAG